MKFEKFMLMAVMAIMGGVVLSFADENAQSGSQADNGPGSVDPPEDGDDDADGGENAVESDSAPTEGQPQADGDNGDDNPAASMAESGD